MKKLFIIFILIVLLTSCDVNRPISTSESPASFGASDPATLTYKEMRLKIDSFLRVFYAEDKDYTLKEVESSEYDGVVRGYYKDDART